MGQKIGTVLFKSKGCQHKIVNFAETYHILSLAYLKIPDEELVSRAEQIGIFSNLDIAELSSDYTRLFIGPYKLLAPAWESVYRSADRLVCQQSLLEVKELYREAGLVLNTGNFLDDHIGIELEFMSYLYKNNINELKEKFIREHLIKWVPLFCNDIIKHAQTSFYKDLALFTKDIIDNSLFRL